MTITHLKRGKPEAERAQDDAQVRDSVERTLADIEARGDAAVRELSAKFDSYTPESFRLSQPQIDALIAELTPRELEDIKFAQAQVEVCTSPTGQHDRHRGRDPARRRARSSQHPGPIGRLLRAGWQVSDGRLGSYVRGHGESCGRAAHHRLHPPLQGQAQPGGDRSDAFWRRA